MINRVSKATKHLASALTDPQDYNGSGQPAAEKSQGSKMGKQQGTTSGSKPEAYKNQYTSSAATNPNSLPLATCDRCGEQQMTASHNAVQHNNQVQHRSQSQTNPNANRANMGPRSSDRPQQMYCQYHMRTCAEQHEIFVHLGQRIQGLEDERETLQRGKSSLETESRALRHRNEALNEEIRSLQATSFSSLENARWMPMDTGLIQSELEDLRSSIWKLAKAYATESLQERSLGSEGPAHKLGWVSSLKHVVRFKSEGVEAVDELMSIRRGSQLCLTALVSDYMHNRILENPFFFMDDGLDAKFGRLDPEDQDLKDRMNPARAFEEVWIEGQKYDSRKAEMWRSDTIRLLNPLHLDNQEANVCAAQMMQTVDETCAQYAARCAKRIPEPLLRRMESSTHAEFVQELVKVFQQAGRLSMRLWVQRPSLRCRYLSDLAETRFDIKAGILHAHSLHHVDDPEDHSLDGKSIKIMVHPAILAKGTHEAEAYDTFQIWARAVVWLDVD